MDDNWQLSSFNDICKNEKTLQVYLGKNVLFMQKDLKMKIDTLL